MKTYVKISLVSLWLLSAFSFATEKTVYTYLGPGPMEGFDRQLLKLALDKTVEDFGPYEVRYAPEMTEARAQKIIRERSYPHPIRSDAAHPEVIRDPDFEYVPFPIYFGILGYRVCFVPEKLTQTFAEISTMKALYPFTHGQGEGWRDVEILRENGFKVKKAPNQVSLYKMVNAGRIDLFCRGTNEVLNEKRHYNGLKNVKLDESFALYYPFPFFFYANSADLHVLDRLEKGILLAYEDGSMKKLWLKHFEESVLHSKLEERTIFTLENRYTNGIPFKYEQYLYQPDGSF